MRMLQGSSHDSVKVDRGACMCMVGTPWLHQFAYMWGATAGRFGKRSSGLYQYKRRDKDAETSGHHLVGAAVCCMR